MMEIGLLPTMLGLQKVNMANGLRKERWMTTL